MIRKAGHQHSHVLDVFIEDFCNQVKFALQGEAIPRYPERTENLNAPPERLELTDHPHANAFNRSHLLSCFDERSIDNLYDQTLKAVFGLRLGFALCPRARAMVAALLHRFDEVKVRRVTLRKTNVLQLDRSIRHWEPVFARGTWLLEGLSPDVCSGRAAGSALLFNSETLFETVLDLRIRHGCHASAGNRTSVGLQCPMTNLATSGFQIHPDIIIQTRTESFTIITAK